MHAPGTDFKRTIESIRYLRDCHSKSTLIRKQVTFHIYYSNEHKPPNSYNTEKLLSEPYNCTIAPPFLDYSNDELYKTQNKMLYPVNVGRNIARQAAITHFVLPCDIELYPTPGLPRKFLEMIAGNDVAYERHGQRVYPLTVFEVHEDSLVPKTKTDLQEMLKTRKAIPFHKYVCPECHNVPKYKEWVAKNETEGLGVFHVGKRHGKYLNWEPIFIGTNAEPPYDNRLSWDGERDKMTQVFYFFTLRDLDISKYWLLLF